MRQIKTIIVDDESRIRRGLEKLVLSNGEEWHVVATFSDGQELVDAYDQNKIDFDVLITDVRMPVMDGLTLIKEMKSRAVFSPIVISGFDDFSYLQSALREGALDYLIKPVDRQEFRKQLTVLKERIQKQWLEAEQLAIIEKKATQLSYVKQIEKLRELTRNDEIDVSIFEWTNEFPNGSYILMQITLDQALSHSRTMSKEDWHAWLFAYENKLNELSNELGDRCWRWRGEGAAFWVLLSCNQKAEAVFRKEVSEFAHLLQTHSANSISISSVFNDLTLLPTIKKDLLILSNFRFIYGEQQIFQQGEEKALIIENNGLENAKEIQQIINRIIQALERLSEQEIKQQLQQFMAELKRIRSPIEIQHYVQALSIQLISYLIKHTPRISSDILDFQDAVRLLKKTGNYSELQAEIECWLSTILKTLEKLDEEKFLDQIKVAKEWIIKNLHENITIEKIAGQVYMNPTYFCEYFKNQTGETVLNFVTSARINQARDLVLTTNLKMYEISEQVGYSDTKYFSKLFKTYYGEPPSIYREKFKANIITR